MEKKRSIEIDIFKGLLIVLVVVGHYDSSIMHDVLFLFHMPLFFVISGLLLKKECLIEIKYIKTKIQNLMIPYFVYLIIDLSLIRRDFASGTLIRALWGGRAVTGVYWYITCFLFTLFLLSVLIKKISDKMSKILILVWGGDSSNRITSC